MTGQVVGQYRIEDKLGAGGMGVVYRAYDTRLQRTVALKVVGDDADSSDAAARLLQEARAVSALNHPNICTVYEVVEADGHSFIVMEYVEGRPLQDVIPPGGLPTEPALRYGRAIADALEHAHGRGVVHRDLKSANIMITAEEHVKVLDFGLARRLESGGDITATLASFSETGGLAGTLPYMAPEVLRSEPFDRRSDVWALGVVLYEMAAGELPFKGQSGFEVSAAILDRPMPPLPARVPVGLATTIERCLTKPLLERYQGADEVRAALDTVHTGSARHATKWWVAAAAMLLVTLVATWFLRSQWPAARPAPISATGPASAAGVPVRKAVAVLGFKNVSARQEAAWLSTAFAEMLTTELAAGERLRDDFG